MNRPDRHGQRRNVWVRILILAALPMAAYLVAFPSFLRPCSCGQEPRRDRHVCIANLKQIEGAKATWALDRNKQPADMPRPSDLYGPAGYIRARNFCPAGGAYRIGRVDEKPTCTHLGHTL